jgi:hypothetical protein
MSCHTIRDNFDRSAPVVRWRLHACSPPTPERSRVQQCSVSGPALPILSAFLISPIGPYTTQIMVFANAKSSLLPSFASSDQKSAATVRIGHSMCDIVTASDPIPHAQLNDFGVPGGFMQVLRLKSFVADNMMMNAQLAVSDAVVSAVGVVLTTSSDAVAKLLKVKRKRTMEFLHRF